MKITTLVFLVKEQNGEITEICLAEKQRGFAAGKWDAPGGKVESRDASIKHGAAREVREEINVDVDPKNLEKVALIQYNYHNPEETQLLHIYTCRTWEGEPSNSEEMHPKWFKITEIPSDKMWEDEVLWLNDVLHGIKVSGEVSFDEDYKMVDYKVDKHSEQEVEWDKVL